MQEMYSRGRWKETYRLRHLYCSDMNVCQPLIGEQGRRPTPIQFTWYCQAWRTVDQLFYILAYKLLSIATSLVQSNELRLKCRRIDTPLKVVCSRFSRKRIQNLVQRCLDRKNRNLDLRNRIPGFLNPKSFLLLDIHRFLGQRTTFRPLPIFPFINQAYIMATFKIFYSLYYAWKKR